MTPLEYSLVMTSMPSTPMASCPRPIPVPRMKPTGSAMALISGPTVRRGCGAESSAPAAIGTMRPVTEAIKL